MTRINQDIIRGSGARYLNHLTGHGYSFNMLMTLSNHSTLTSIIKIHENSIRRHQNRSIQSQHRQWIRLSVLSGFQENGRRDRSDWSIS